MKKNYIKIMASAALVLLFASCQENEFEGVGPDGVVGKNEVAFAIGSPDTRSAVALSDVTEQGASIFLGTDDMGNNIYLEETVIDLNSPVTRGTPVYTENVWKMNPSLFAHSELGDDEYEYKEATGYYSKAYGENIWEYASDKKTLNFYMYMPYSITSYGVTAAPTFAVTSGKQTISFGYKSPETAAEQADIIFAAKQIIKSEYEGTRDDNNNHYAEVLFHHALTGVKFAIGNEDDDISSNSIKINKVSFTGLNDSGNCVVTPTKENDKYQDTQNIYSSQAENVVVWKDLSATDDYTMSASFTKTVDFAKPTTEGGTGTFKEGDKSNGEYPGSFAAKGNEKNLNDGNATQTFWLIPQTMTDDVKLTVYYSFGDKDDYEWTFDFGAALSKVTWKAGQLRTYTIRIDEVKIHISDSIADEAKTDIAIKNTGNTDAFIRATIIGNWCADNGEAVFGYTDFIDNPGEYVEIPSWTIETPGGGQFVGLPGSGWVRGNDGYYYYTTALAPAATAPALFTSYTPGDAPNYQLAGKNIDAHFVMEIATQAVSAKKTNGDNYTWADAWKNVLTYDPSSTN